MRNQSQHIVRLFDPDKEPDVKEMLYQEQGRNLSVKAISARKRHGLVTTPKGVFCVTEDGFGPSRPIDRLGVPIGFYRDAEKHPFITAIYGLAECEKYVTGETVRLDEFVSTEREAAYAAWEKRLS